MLSFKNRLSKTKEINEVLKNGAMIKSDLFVLKYMKNKKEESRFSFVVSQKISKKAVERNRLKRRFREIIRKDLHNIKKGFDIVILARKKAKVSDFADLKKSLKFLFKKASLYDNRTFD